MSLRCPFDNQVPAELLAENERARLVAKEMLSDETIASFREMRQILEDNSAALRQIDRTFIIELAYLEKADEALDAAIKAKVQALLPSATVHKSFVQVDMEMRELMKSDMCKRCSRSTAGQVEAVLEVLTNMQRGISPDPLRATSGFYKEVLPRCAWFCCFEATAGKKTYGVEALRSHFASVKAAITDQPNATLGQLEVFQTYKWLLDEEQKVDLAAWVAAAVRAGARPAQRDTTRAAAPAAKAKAKAKGQAGATVMNLFS